MQQIIGLKDFKQNPDAYAKKVHQGHSFIVVKQSKPLFKIGPITDNVFSKKFLQSLDRAENELRISQRDIKNKKGKVLGSLRDLR